VNLAHLLSDAHVHGCELLLPWYVHTRAQKSHCQGAHISQVAPIALNPRLIEGFTKENAGCWIRLLSAILIDFSGW